MSHHHKAPAFQFYPSDFLASTSEMSAEEVGIHIRLLCNQWLKGGLPNDDARLMALAGQCQASSLAYAKSRFGICEDGMLRHPRLEAERAKQAEYREKQAKNGAKRWAGNANPDAKPQAVAMPSLMPTHMPNACSLSPSLSSSMSLTHIKDSTHQGYKGGVGEGRDGACAPAIENGSESIQSDPKDAAAMSRRLDDKNAPERQKRLKAEAYHEHSRTVLHYLNQATGRNYRELAANLDPISARLNEPGVDLEGVKLMIDRQVKLWGGTEMQEYLKPTTLFRVSKFDGYYASRLVEISRPKTAFEKMCPPPLHDWSKEEGGEIDFASISQEGQ